LQAHHIRTWLNGLRTTCQCCAPGEDAERAKKGQDVPAPVDAPRVGLTGRPSRLFSGAHREYDGVRVDIIIIIGVQETDGSIRRRIVTFDPLDDSHAYART
jgi:hypothetical protein